MSNSLKEATSPPNSCKVENVIMTGGMLNNVAGNQHIYHGSRETFELLRQNVSSAAFHNSKERFDPPKCHENTRTAVLKKIMDWIMSCDPDTRDKLIMWIRGAAGAGKSAIAQTLAELCEQRSLILASYFFSRFDSTRNHPRALIATIAYQMCTTIPAMQDHILDAIDSDRLIFERNLIAQVTTLIHQPLQKLMQGSTSTTSRKVIVIDGLDECKGDDAQREVIDALFHVVNRLRTPIIVLVASRPELNITTLFDEDTSDALGRIFLDADYSRYEDIELFLRDKFRRIKETHRLKRYLPSTWPNNETIYILVSKSSGQFIYASTVIKYVKFPRGRPDLRLETIQGLRPPQNDKDMPFAELDKLYAHILSTLEDTALVLDILRFVENIRSYVDCDISLLECIFELGAGGIETLLCDLGSLIDIVGNFMNRQIIKILHASFQDFLADPARSREYYRNQTQVILDQLKRCFRFIMKSGSGHSNATVGNALHLAAIFFVKMEKHVQCNMELANILDIHSLLRCLPAFTEKICEYYVVSFIPQVLHFFKRSDMIEAYLKLQMALDDEYISIVIEQYYTDTKLSFLLTYLCLFQKKGMVWGQHRWPSFYKHFDYEGLFLRTTSRNYAFNIEIIDKIIRYLRSPRRSKRYSIETSGGRLYSNALLYVLSLLHEPGLHSIQYVLVDPDRKYSDNILQPYDERDRQILSRWTQNEPRHSHEDRCGGVPDAARDFFTYLENLQTSYEDDPSIPNDPSLDMWNRESDDMYMHLNGPFLPIYLVSAALYFFPRAGRCDKLLDLCKTKYVPKALFSLKHKEIIFRTMDAYVDRWKDGGSGSPDVDEWAYPFPLVERKVSIFTDEEKMEILKLRAQSST